MQYTSREVYEFISKQTNDPIVERKNCAVSGQPFAIFQSDLDFYSKISPSFAGQKFPISTPTLCPEERQRKRLSFRNERKLYRRQCDASKKSIISIYSPDKSYKVYDQKIRRSDSWDPMDYGREFDFGKTFTEHITELYQKVPKYNLNNDYQSCHHSEYVNYCGNLKNSYYCFGVGQSQDCMYCDIARESSDTMEMFNGMQTSSSYFMINTIDNFNCRYCYSVIHSDSILYSSFLTNCKYCIGCYDLVGKSYYINNIQYTPEEYHQHTKQITHTQGLAMFYQSLNSALKPNMFMLQSEGCFGDLLYNSKNSIFCYDSFAIDSKFTTSSGGANDSYDTDHLSYGSAHCFEIMASQGQFLYMNNGSKSSTSLYYCIDCFSSENNFGCIGLRNKQYCIFNKQYTKEEYEVQVAKIIAHMQQTGEWGEFFHPSLSPFGYNETVAQEYFPIGRDMLLACPQQGHMANTSLQQFGYHRSDYNADPSIPEGIQTIEKKNYTDEQRSQLLSQDNLETQVFICSISARPYRLQKAEIEFYRKHHLPIPDKHPDVRHEERMKLRPGRTLYLRTCDCCSKEMLSVYAPKEVLLGDASDYKGKVYCESCYQKEVYS